MKLFMKNKAYKELNSSQFNAGQNNIVNSNVVLMSEPLPDSVTLTHEFVKMYLSTKGCVLWQQWDITSEDGLDDAATWLISEFENLVEFLGEAFMGDSDEAK